MFKNLKMLAAITILLTAHLAQAEKITVAVPFPPGGTLDQVMQILKVAAQKQGNQIDVQYHKSCAESIEFVKNRSNAFLNIVNDIYDPGNPNAACLLDPGKDEFRVWASLTQSPFYFCSAPGKQLSFNEAVQKPHTVGYVAASDMTNYVNYMLANVKGSTQFKAVPYRGGGPLTKAVQAGDVDLWFGSAQIRTFPTATCYGSGVRNNPRKILFIGDLTKPGTNLPELALMNILITDPKRISKEAANVIVSAVESLEFKEYLEKNKITPGTFDGQKVHNELIKSTQAIKKIQTN